jgi:hypothetical protein
MLSVMIKVMRFYHARIFEGAEKSSIFESVEANTVQIGANTLHEYALIVLQTTSAGLKF